MTTMKCCRRLAGIGVAAAACLTLAAAALAEQPRWQMHRTLLDSPMMDAAFPDDNTVLIANQNGLVTLNTEAEVLKRQGIDSTVSYPILAENGSYAVVHHRRRVPQFSENITLYSVAGETGVTFPISGSPYLAPNGDWLLTVDKYNNRVSIYNARGAKLREDTYPEIRDYGMKFSTDGRHVALNLPQNGVDAIAVVYDSIGRLQTKVRHALGLGPGAAGADAEWGYAGDYCAGGGDDLRRDRHGEAADSAKQECGNWDVDKGWREIVAG